MKKWQRPRLEHTRNSFDDVQGRLGSAYELWIDVMNIVRPAVMAAVLGDPIDPQGMANYPPLRDEWMRRWHGFRQDVESLYLDSEHVPHGAFPAIERCWYYPSLKEAVTRIREYGRDEMIESGTFTPATDFWAQINGRMDDISRTLPSHQRERIHAVSQWLRSRPDWIEAHPRTLMALGLLVAGILAWQFPSILHEITDLIRAARGA